MQYNTHMRPDNRTSPLIIRFSGQPMTPSKLFLHGVPDSPIVWKPLLNELGDLGVEIATPALPGFCGPLPDGLTPTKEGYTDWLISELEHLYKASGPIDIVGHDWGALLTLRAASLRPDLINSWAVSGAVIHPDYRGHTTAKHWATPVLGEIVMAITTPKLLEKALVEQAVPDQIARAEAQNWNPTMRKCILSLYRSAKGLNFEAEWINQLEALPERGLVMWGKNDPYVAADFGRQFARQRALPFYLVEDTGHWMIAERPDVAAQYLQQLWTTG